MKNRYQLLMNTRLLLLASSLIFAQTFAADITSKAVTGNWNVGSNWVGESAPGPGDNAIIVSGATISLTGATSITDVTVNSGGTLDLNGNDLDINGNLLVNGDLYDNAAYDILYLSGNLTINSGATIGTGGGGGTFFYLEFDGVGGTQSISGTFSGTIELAGLYITGSSTVDNNLSVTQFDIDEQYVQNGGTFLAGSSLYNFLYSTNNGYFFDKSNGTFTAETSTFKYSLNRNIRMTTEADITFYNLEHSPSNGRGLELDETNAAGAVYTIENMLIRSGSSSAISFRNSASLRYAGTNETLVYDVGSATDVTEEWPSSNGPANVELRSNLGGDVTLSESRTISNLTLLQNPTTGDLLVDDGSAGTITLTVNTKLARKTTGTTGVSVGTADAIAYGSGAEVEYDPISKAAITIGAEWTGSNNPHNVTVNNGAFTLSGTGARTISEVLDLSNGTLDLGNAELSVLGDVISSDVAGSGIIADNTTLVMGDNSTPANSDEDQTISGTISLNKLIVNKTGGTNNLVTLTGSLTFTSNGSLTITNGDLVLTATSILKGQTGSLALTVASGGKLETGGQDLTNLGSLSASAGTIEFNGSSGETLPTGTIGTVEIDNAAGVTMSSGLLTVNTSLILTNGIITTTTSNLLRLAAGASINGTPSATNMIEGPLQVAFASGNTPAVTYPIGFDGNYMPAVFDYNSNSVATSIIEIEAHGALAPSTAPTGIASVSTLSHYCFSERGTSGTFNYDITLTHSLSGFSPSTRNKILRQISSAPTWEYDSVNQGAAGASTQTLSNQTAFPSNDGYFGFGAAGGATIYWTGGGANNNWSTVANWSAAPIAGDIIILTNDGVDGRPNNTTDITAIYDASVTPTDFAAIRLIEVGTSTEVRLTLSKAVTIDITDTSPNGLLLSGNSVLVYNGSSVEMAGSGYNPARTTFAGESTVLYQSASGVPVYGDTYGHLQVNVSATINQTNAVSVAGDYIKSGSGTHTVDGVNLSVTGSTTINSGTLSAINAGSFTLQGSVVNNGVFNLSGSGTSNINGACSGSGDYTTANGTVNFANLLSLSASTQFTVGSAVNTSNALTLASGAVLTINSSLNHSGASFTNNGATINGSGVFVFSGNSAQTISGTSTFADLTLNNTHSSGISADADITTNGDLILVDGILSMNGNAFILGNSSTVSGGNDASHIDGTVTLIATSGTTERFAPVGDGGTGRRLGIKPSTAGDTYQVTFNFSNPQEDFGPDLLNIDAISRLYYWNVTTSGTRSFRVRVHWEDGFADGVLGGAEDDLRPGRWDSGNSEWVDMGRSGSDDNTPGNVQSDAFLSSNAVVTLATLGTDNSLPVALTTFAARLQSDGVSLHWSVASELHNQAFMIERRLADSDDYFATIGEVEGRGTVADAADYAFVDKDVLAGETYVYRLTSRDYSGLLHRYGNGQIEVFAELLPEGYVLEGNYPNPFNPTTTIRFSLANEARVSLVVFDVTGRKITTLVNDRQLAADRHEYLWNGEDAAGRVVASGVYFYRLIVNAGESVQTRRMLLIK
jgi:hypothetical protein